MRDSRELKICERCDHGHSVAIFRGSPVACKVDKLIHRASDCCNNWKQLTMETIQKDMDAKMSDTPGARLYPKLYWEDEVDFLRQTQAQCHEYLEK